MAVETHVARFLLTQAVMLALGGVPAIYIHSLLGTGNDYAGLERLGYNRAINRPKLDVDRVSAELEAPGSFRAQVFAGYTHLLRTRRGLPAFHPHGAQQARVLAGGRVLALERTAPDGSQWVTSLFNFSGQPQAAEVDAAGVDALSGEAFAAGEVGLAPYQVRWLVRGQQSPAGQ
jgi:sucrose phosphorylase